MADLTSSAAGKVFGVAELAEHILFYLARAGIEASGGQSKHDALQPIVCLSAVQRVSSVFRDTITTSKKIQRLVQTTTQDGAEGRMRWLLQGMLGLSLKKIVPRGAFRFGPMVEGEIEEINTQKGRHRTQFEHFSSGYRSGSEASWRKIEIADSDYTARVINIRAIKFPYGERSQGYGGESWKIERGATLGVLFNKYHGVMRRTRKQHRLAKRDFKAALRRESRGTGENRAALRKEWRASGKAASSSGRRRIS